MPEQMTFTQVWPLVKQSFTEWMEDKVPKMAAALAYYTAISLAPLIIIAIKVVGVVKGPEAASKQLHDQLVTFTDPRIADALQDTIHKAGQPGSGTFATIVSVVIALFGASGVFAELQDSLNTIWEVRPRQDRGIAGIVRDRFLSMTMVLGIAFLLLVSMFLSTAISTVSTGLIDATLGSSGGMLSKMIALGIDIVFSTVIVTVLFAAIFKVLPDAKISWRDVWLGGFVTTVLFQLGKYGLSLYLSKASPTSAYGAAGSMVAVLLWVYYSSQILFFGAEFTQVYANRFGTRIVPAANAEPLTEEMRRQAGIPHSGRSGVLKAAGPQPMRRRPNPLSARRVGGTTARTHGRRPESHIVRYLPVFAGVVLGRFIWKRYQRAHAPRPSIGSRWANASEQWKRLARLLFVRPIQGVKASEALSG